MNLYEVKTRIRTGRPNSTHYDNNVTLHVSAATIDSVAARAVTKGKRWASHEHLWFVNNDPGVPIRVLVDSIVLLDEDWE